MQKPKPLSELRVQIYADGSKKEDMLALAKNPLIRGFTTNPTLMRKAGVEGYAAFAKEMTAAIPDKPISFEVFSDDFGEMERQARIIAGFGENIYAKIPITNTKGESAFGLIRALSGDGVKLNITMILSQEQVAIAVDALSSTVPSIVSVFAGRAADLGYDPMALMRESKAITKEKPMTALLWASTREVYNIYEAEETGAEIITVPPAILEKAFLIGSTLEEASLEGVRVFYEDGKAAGYSL
ncbi:MAG: transaldolase [Patescibacteria group bacterium]|nr:transaldolase [Patescibacteria group bacterium]